MERAMSRLCAPRRSVALFLCLSLIASNWCIGARAARAQAPSGGTTGQPAPEAKTEVFHKCIKYLGGPGFPDLRGKESWDNNLSIGATTGTCTFANADLMPVTFQLASVDRIVYGQASTRHAGVWISVGVLLAPIALLGLLHKSRKHNVLLGWKDADGHEGGAYFEVKADDYRRLLNTLSYRTGKPVWADEKDREWLKTQGVIAEPDPEESTTSKK